MFVTFEGMDGSGKTTQVERLRAALEAEGREVVTAREPGQTELGEAIREPRSPRRPDDSLGGGAALRGLPRGGGRRGGAAGADRGADVLLDRYLDSSIVYQGIGRGLGVDEVLEVNLLATGGLLPDRTFVLSIEPGTSRPASAPSPTGSNGRTPPSTERVAEGYEELAALFPERVVVLDGSLDPDALAERIHGELQRVG